MWLSLSSTPLKKLISNRNARGKGPIMEGAWGDGESFDFIFYFWIKGKVKSVNWGTRFVRVVIHTWIWIHTEAVIGCHSNEWMALAGGLTLSHFCPPSSAQITCIIVSNPCEEINIIVGVRKGNHRFGTIHRLLKMERKPDSLSIPLKRLSNLDTMIFLKKANPSSLKIGQTK